VGECIDNYALAPLQHWFTMDNGIPFINMNRSFTHHYRVLEAPKFLNTGNYQGEMITAHVLLIYMKHLIISCVSHGKNF